MKSFRFFSLAGFLVFALLGACFSAATASGADSKEGLSNWDNLKSLTPGQEIRVVMNDLKSYQGKFQSLGDQGITLWHESMGELMLARKDILRVSQMTGKDHRKRNTAIGMLVGGVAGLVIGLTPYHNRNCTEGPAFNCGYPPNAHLLEVLTPVGALAGGAIGSVSPTGKAQDIYRAR